MTTADDSIPDKCPVTGSESAGKALTCEGCPNQKLCASGTTQQVDPAVEEIKGRLAEVKRKILILSGKGGVGKSMLTAQLSRGLAHYNTLQVMALDIDICGPSMPRLMGVEGEQVHQSASGWSPVFVDDNLALMSVGFLLNSPDDAVIWRGPKKNGLIKQFLRDVDWSEADYLLIDTPPGTSDEHLSIIQYLGGAKIDGAIIVTTPQEISLLDVRKEINFCKRLGINVLGVVENMTGFICPKCNTESKIFKPSSGGAAAMTQQMAVEFLGQIPLDPNIGQCCDEGKSFLTELPDSASTRAIMSIVNRIRQQLEHDTTSLTDDNVDT